MCLRQERGEDAQYLFVLVSHSKFSKCSEEANFLVVVLKPVRKINVFSRPMFSCTVSPHLAIQLDKHSIIKQGQFSLTHTMSCKRVTYTEVNKAAAHTPYWDGEDEDKPHNILINEYYCVFECVCVYMYVNVNVYVIVSGCGLHRALRSRLTMISQSL